MKISTACFWCFSALLPGFVSGPGQATPVLSTQLRHLTVFAGSGPAFEAGYITTGARSFVYGNTLAGDVSTIGASGTVTGNAVSVNASTIGGYFDASYTGAHVGGNLMAGGVATTGDSSAVDGTLRASGAATLGARAVVRGDVSAGGVGTAGALAHIGGNFLALGAGTAGATAVIDGTMTTGGLLSVAADALVRNVVASAGGFSDPTPDIKIVLHATPVMSSAGIRHDVAKESADVQNAQTMLGAMPDSPGMMGHDVNNKAYTAALDATITVDTTLEPGVYSAASLSTTAGTTLLLDGHGLDNQSWVFNITDILAIGASTLTRILNPGLNNTVYWNVLDGYASVGASATLTGTILAKTYISVGANTIVRAADGTCGGIYSRTSYVSTGDSSRIGGQGCTDTPHEVPAPAPFALLIAGLGVLALALRRMPASMARCRPAM